MQNDLFYQGVNLMLMGMGTVFIFLTLLVLATNAMSKVIQTFFPEPLADTPLAPPPENSDDASPDVRVLAAIKAAVAEHRRRRQG